MVIPLCEESQTYCSSLPVKPLDIGKLLSEKLLFDKTATYTLKFSTTRKTWGDYWHNTYCLSVICVQWLGVNVLKLKKYDLNEMRVKNSSTG